ncbi:unnamed protein product [Sphagnum troendelagicum]|uniref:RIN4 pathogenic type III effector avirulence factor Avr cleavage site domain-containing protein n=1 Tax=Sphagnum troendelagicum TaxID=128251 RepID=A0ABP0V350_9BRYO
MTRRKTDVCERDDTLVENSRAGGLLRTTRSSASVSVVQRKRCAELKKSLDGRWENDESQEEEVDLRQQTEQPGRYSYEPPSRRPPGEVPPNRQHGDNARYAARGGAAGGPARAVPSEPLHRRGVVDQDSNHNSDRSNGERSSTDGSSGRSAHRGGGRGGCPPTWDPGRRVPSGDDISTPGTLSKSRLSAGIGRPEEPPARGGALPKFGAWDAGDGFTMIFQKASVEKKEGGPVRIPQMSNELLPGSLEDPHQNQSSAQSKRPSQSRSNVSSHHN